MHQFSVKNKINAIRLRILTTLIINQILVVMIMLTETGRKSYPTIFRPKEDSLYLPKQKVLQVITSTLRNFVCLSVCTDSSMATIAQEMTSVFNHQLVMPMLHISVE